MIRRQSDRVWPYDDDLGADWPEAVPRSSSGRPSASLSRSACIRHTHRAAWTHVVRVTRCSSPRSCRTPLSIVFAFVATHNHFVLDRGGKVFNRSAPVIKLPVGASEDDHLGLVGVLNSSAACFWLKQVSHDEGWLMASGGGFSPRTVDRVLRVHRHEAAGVPAARDAAAGVGSPPRLPRAAVGRVDPDGGVRIGCPVPRRSRCRPCRVPAHPRGDDRRAGGAGLAGATACTAWSTRT